MAEENDEFCLGHDDSEISFRHKEVRLNRKLNITEERMWFKKEMCDGN